jgi:hypothetical protein
MRPVIPRGFGRGTTGACKGRLVGRMMLAGVVSVLVMMVVPIRVMVMVMVRMVAMVVMSVCRICLIVVVLVMMTAPMVYLVLTRSVGRRPWLSVVICLPHVVGRVPAIIRVRHHA